MKRTKLLLGFLILTVQAVLAQISHTATFDPPEVKVTETIIENGKQIYPKSSKKCHELIPTPPYGSRGSHLVV